MDKFSVFTQIDSFILGLDYAANFKHTKSECIQAIKDCFFNRSSEFHEIALEYVNNLFGNTK